MSDDSEVPQQRNAELTPTLLRPWRRQQGDMITPGHQNTRFRKVDVRRVYLALLGSCCAILAWSLVLRSADVRSMLPLSSSA